MSSVWLESWCFQTLGGNTVQIPLKQKLRLTSGYLRLLILMNQPAKNWVRVLIWIINSISKEKFDCFQLVGQREFWKPGNLQWHLLAQSLIANGKLGHHQLVRATRDLGSIGVKIWVTPSRKRASLIDVGRE